jgi:hypothetical protein
MEIKTTKGGFYMVTEEITFETPENDPPLAEENFKDGYEFFPDSSI